MAEKKTMMTMYTGNYGCYMLLDLKYNNYRF